MGETGFPLLTILLRAGALAFIVNELRGLILAAPILYGMYQAGGTLMAIWLGICSLAGIGLSVVVPAVALKKIGSKLARSDCKAD